MDAEAKRRRVTAEASLASPPTVRAPAGAFETPARGKTDGEARDGGSGASTATPLMKRKARAGETGEGMVFAAMPTFARALRDAREAEAEARTANMMLCDERVKCACARAGMERRSSECRVTSKRARAESHPITGNCGRLGQGCRARRL